MEGGLLDMHLGQESHSNTKGEPLEYFNLPGGIVMLLSARTLPRCGFDDDLYWVDESSDISL